ncbi:hypothetical protein PTSG_09579 [Salpingoeca rosetta]|uniref:Uncharacterized protein n=1 Tax=Salpingoeca rosetta (strain ATCC 50818 / BSB-021) TaxID=946362 RepID=F2ULE5_SALR5|nr:uncharacterized protein PTSG_09579 [Salpingoeca rosetta]EGD77944.1 hypothetical protein PTSG_09579 [Salpingoeca rosetta]|eukprot:XP_004990007.1 hypothetical protein PTSG_09579 [Salpingoeca rosetta]
MFARLLRRKQRSTEESDDAASNSDRGGRTTRRSLATRRQDQDAGLSSEREQQEAQQQRQQQGHPDHTQQITTTTPRKQSARKKRKNRRRSSARGPRSRRSTATLSPDTRSSNGSNSRPGSRPSSRQTGRRQSRRRRSTRGSTRNSLDENCLYLGEEFNLPDAIPEGQQAMDAEDLLALLFAQNKEDIAPPRASTSMVPVYERKHSTDAVIPYLRKKKMELPPRPAKWRETVWDRPSYAQPRRRASSMDNFGLGYYGSGDGDETDDEYDEEDDEYGYDDDDGDDDGDDESDGADADDDTRAAGGDDSANDGEYLDIPSGSPKYHNPFGHALKPTTLYQPNSKSSTLPAQTHGVHRETPLGRETAMMMENRWLAMTIKKTKEDFTRVPEPPNMSKLDLNC